MSAATDTPIVGYMVHSSADESHAAMYPLGEADKAERRMVHQVICHAFHGPQPTPAHEVRHIDGDSANNLPDNLCWGTRKQNAADREAHGRTSRGEAHSAAIKASTQAEGTRAFRRAQKEASHV
jgi:hypothetical protein